MPPDLSPEEVRDRTFETARRGYDKDPVDRFRTEVADEIGRLRGHIEALEGQLSQLGIDDVGDLGAELQRVGSDISTILEEARRTATELRERATEDATKWRTEAEAQAVAMRAASQQEAEQMRADAWNQSSQMLEQVTQDVENQIAVAKQDALFIRAEAERESLHMTADARREAEELARAARTEAERMTASAQAKATRTLDEARQAAEGAQERAKALESRRSELLIELDAARQSIGQLERQIDERREELEESDQSEEEAWGPEPTHWGDDDGAVRLVNPVRLKEPTPVDADELVHEVEQLRGEEPEPPPEPTTEDDADADEAAAGASTDVEPVDRDEAPATEAPATEAAATEAAATEAAATEAAAIEGVPEPPEFAEVDDIPGDEVAEAIDVEAADAVAPEDAAPAGAMDEPSPPAVPPAEDEAPSGDGAEDVAADATVTEPAAVAEEPAGDPEEGALDDLFQRLRTDGTEPDSASEPPETAPMESTDSTELELVVEPAVDDAEPLAEAAVAELAPPSAAITAASAVEMRDRLLLPIENRALRGVKRRIVDLQNRALEELRIGDGPWVPDKAMFAADLGPDLMKLAQESYVAGHRAAAEMSDTTGTSPPATRTRTDATSLLVDGLAAGLTEAYDRAVAQDSGARQLAAAVSRVFRAWRTDEAERQLRMASYTAYHEGIVAGLAAQGVPQAIVVAEGAHGKQCPSVTGVAFDPGESSALRLPPAHDECPATVVLFSELAPQQA